MTDSDDIRDLPDILARFAEAAGHGAALRLAHDFGGRELYVPERAGPDHPLVQSLGQEATEILIRLIGPGRILVPMGPAASHHRRGQTIMQLIEKQKSRAEISKQVGVHVRTVARYRRRRREDAGVRDLFS